MILSIDFLCSMCNVLEHEKHVLYECIMHANIRCVYLPVKIDGHHYRVPYVLCTTNPDVILCTTFFKCGKKYNEMYILYCAV